MAKKTDKKSDKTEAKASKETGSRADTKPAPIFRPLGQYIKDLSFECPKAPMLTPENDRHLDLNIGVNAAVLNEERGLYEVTLAIRAQAVDSAKITVFMADLAYSGVFEVQHIPAEQLAAVLNIDGPALLFPFARQILASTLAESGFTPPMLEPINFAALFAQQVQKDKNESDIKDN